MDAASLNGVREEVRQALNDCRSARALLGDHGALGALRLNVAIEKLEQLAAFLDEEAEWLPDHGDVETDCLEFRLLDADRRRKDGSS